MHVKGQSPIATQRRETRSGEPFGTYELAIVLSHYELGRITAIQEFRRGSRRDPKLWIDTEGGRYILKRRGGKQDQVANVRFCHALQRQLYKQGYPAPRLVGTRGRNNSMLHWGGHVYEVSEYIDGEKYDGSLAATEAAGGALAEFHRAVRGHQPAEAPAAKDYHATRAVRPAAEQIPRTLAQADPRAAEESARVERVSQWLLDVYQEAATEAEGTGMPGWPGQVVHGDWHPGNILFRGHQVVGVVDFDAARVKQRVTDLANGALQFSNLGGDEPAQWPGYIDASRYKRFLRGYDRVKTLSRGELVAIPWLMIEALIAESLIPIAATGSFAWIEGFDFLLMIERKVRWLRDHVDELSRVLRR